MHADLTLTFERVVTATPAAIYRAWTTPEIMLQWLTPAPWRTIACEVELRPGGVFRSVMCSPDGVEVANVACYLELVPNQKLVWTNALLPGFQPAPSAEGCGDFFLTVVIELEPVSGGTRYRAKALHRDLEGMNKHAAMGFEQGWALALDQMLALIAAGEV
ncbi:SRPBCC family protein [bacterium]|nr:SRPBCC family protein [bacterium]